MSTEPRDFITRGWVSTCCGAPIWGEVDTEFSEKGKGVGICSRCREHSECEPEEQE